MAYTTTFWGMLLVPIAATFMLRWFLREKVVEVPWYKLVLLPLPGFGVVYAMFALSFGASVTDELVVNGQITGKRRIQETYQRSYDCRCARGRCDTCHETRYRVVWLAESTIGSLVIDSASGDSAEIYQEPDPLRYVQLHVGDPVADRREYVNYLQAMSGTVFASTAEAAARKPGATASLPPYPMPAGGAYSVDHFLTVGVDVPDSAEWNRDLSLMLRELGPAKQVNLIIVVVSGADDSYSQALHTHWRGVNKNDVVLVLGTGDGVELSWASVLTWAKSNDFSSSLKAAVMKVGTIERTRILSIVADEISRKFERRQMSEFEFLKAKIDPPWPLLALTLALLLVCYGVIGFVMVRTRQPSRRSRA